MKKCLVLILSLFAALCFGQVETYYVKSVEIDSSYSSDEDSSAISRNSDFQENRLFIFLGGTGSSSSTAYNALRIHSASIGFDFINLNYPNDIAAYSLTNSADSLAFNKFREEICFGTPLSDAVSVDSFNSIYTRALKMLQHLEFTRPLENWGQYLLNSNSIDWSKIILGGHSQGAGHASYLAKHFSVDRVLMFSGPNDYSNFYFNAANWLRKPGLTNITRHFAYLSLNDELVDFSMQFDNLLGLGLLENGDSTYVDHISPPYKNERFLYTSQTPGIVVLNHNVPVKNTDINKDVWTYMLTSWISTAYNNVDRQFNISFYPNPTNSLLHLKIPEDLLYSQYTLRDLQGQLLASSKISGEHDLILDLSRFTAGMYFLNLENQVYNIIKH